MAAIGELRLNEEMMNKRGKLAKGRKNSFTREL